MISLRISNLAHEYENRVVFSGLNADVTGGCVAVIGANGSGKTTLLKIIAGLLTPCSGNAEIVIGERALAREDCRDSIGFAGQDVRLYSELTPRENLRFLASSRGLSGTEERVTGTLELVELSDRADDPVSELSSGLRQRACLAAALLHQPQILLLDEPATNLDEDGVEVVRSVVRARSSSGMVLLATNDPREADLATDRIALG